MNPCDHACDLRNHLSIYLTNANRISVCMAGRSRLWVRPRCSPPTNHRVGGLHLSGGRVVRHDRSTPRPTPTVYLTLPAPHAPIPTSCCTAPWPLGMESNDPCRSSASCPWPPADGICLLDPLAGQKHRRSPAGGRAGARRGGRASSSPTRPVGRAARGGHRSSRLAPL